MTQLGNISYLSFIYLIDFKVGHFIMLNIQAKNKQEPSFLKICIIQYSLQFFILSSII